jgi:hypothetical protein
MSTQPPFQADDATEWENIPLLRATLREHAPEAVEVETAWAAVSAQLAQIRQELPAVSDAPDLRTRPSDARRQLWRGALPKVAAMLVVAVLLMGAGYGGGHYLWGWPFGGQKLQLIGNQHLYTTIGQRQTENGITITVDKAYADADDTFIAFQVDMSSQVTKHYDRIIVASYDLHDQYADSPQTASTQCTPPSNGTQACLMDVAPFHLSGGASELTITFDITKLYLLKDGESTTTELTGHWQFQFTLPYHQKSLGPGGSTSQPSPLPTDAQH